VRQIYQIFEWQKGNIYTRCHAESLIDALSLLSRIVDADERQLMAA